MLLYMKRSNNRSSEEAVRHSINIVGAFRISRASKRSWREPKVEQPDALWLRLKPYVRLAKDRHEG